MNESESQRATRGKDNPDITTNGANEKFDVWYWRLMRQIQRKEIIDGTATMPQ